MKNREVLKLSAPIFGTDEIYFSNSLRNIRDYDFQKVVIKNEAILKDERKQIISALEKTFTDKIELSNPEVIAVLEKESEIKLHFVDVNEMAIKESKPDLDCVKCLEYIKK